MNTRCPSPIHFVICFMVVFGLSLLPTLAAAASPALVIPTDTPAVAVVRQFLAARTAGQYDVAYTLLSADSRRQLPPRAWANSRPPTPSEARKISSPLLGLMALFADPNNTLGYTFIVIGPAPDDPDVVLVRADPRAKAMRMPAVTLRVLTASNPDASTTRVDLVGSLKPHEPREFRQMSQEARRALSQSNLKHLSLAIVQYSQDNDERMPDAMHWVDQIKFYIKDKAVFRDPSAPAGQLWGYAYNRTLSHKSLAQFGAPSLTVMLFESNKSVKNASDTGQSVPHPGRHLGGTDYAFADGHVKWEADGTNLSFLLIGK